MRRDTAGHRIAGAAIALMLLGTGGVARAAATDCDDVLTPEQRQVEELCSTYAGCRLVTGLFDSCVAAKRWVASLDPSDRSPMTDARVAAALENMRSVEATELDDGPRYSHCLPAGFDRGLCRQFLGLDPVPIRVSAPPPARSPEVELRSRAATLLREADEARDRSAGPYRTAATFLASCAQSLELSTREQTCLEAQKRVDECTAARDGWRDRRRVLLADVAAVNPALGSTQAPVSRLRGLGPQPGGEQVWNDMIHRLRGLEIAACPATLPNTFLTPRAALERASGGTAAKPPVRAGTSRPASSDSRGAVTELLKESASGSEDALNDPTRRAQREQEQQMARAAMKQRQRIDQGQQAAANAQVAGAVLAGVQQYAQFEQNAALRASQPSAVAPTAVGAAGPGAGGPSAERPVPPARPAPGAAARDYAPMRCVVEDVDQSSGSARRCARNGCGRSVELHFSGGMVTLAKDACWPLGGSGRILAACEPNDFYNAARGTCRR